MATDCLVFHLVASGETCQGISTQFSISFAQFLTWNPAVQSDCSGLWASTVGVFSPFLPLPNLQREVGRQAMISLTLLLVCVRRDHWDVTECQSRRDADAGTPRNGELLQQVRQDHTRGYV